MKGWQKKVKRKGKSNFVGRRNEINNDLETRE